MGGTRAALVATCALAMLAPSVARADGPERSEDGLSTNYLTDGGAIPFLWLPLAARVALDAYGAPRRSPLMFSEFEGGAAKSEWEIPGWVVTALGGVSALGMIGSGDASRFYHVKGLAQALSTGVLVTGLVKVAIGRHRPDWDAGVNTPGSRRSFPSGHSTQAFAIATYTILFLHGHVFDRLRGESSLPWWEAATYGGIALGAAAVAGERVVHNRHHLLDVGVGAALGTASSSLFYWYQSSRFNADQRGLHLAFRGAQGGGTGGTIGFKFAW